MTTVVEAADVMKETDKRVLRFDIEDSKKRIAALDDQIAKLQKQRDNHVGWVAVQKERLKLLESPPIATVKLNIPK